jgi:hypothetical protein
MDKEQIAREVFDLLVEDVKEVGYRQSLFKNINDRIANWHIAEIEKADQRGYVRGYVAGVKESEVE